MDFGVLEILMICLMIYVGVIILAVWYDIEVPVIEERIRELRRRQQRPTSFMIVAFVYTAQECLQALANKVNFTTSFEIFKEYCCSETYVGSGQPRVLLDDCVICHEKFKATDACLVLGKCGHVFHEQCVRPWFQLQPNCPICRSDIPLFTYE